jgi:hypothetical protein
VAKPTNSSVPRAPAQRDSAPLPVELQTAARLAPTNAPAAQPAQVQLNSAPHGPQLARHGRKTIVLPVRQRALPQAQPARAVRPRTAPSLPNPHGRSRSGQNAMPDQRSSAPLRLAAKLLPVKRGFSTRTLVRCGRPIFTLKRLPAQSVRARPVPARLAPVTAGPQSAVPARLGLMQSGPLPTGHTLIGHARARPGHTLTGLGPAVPVSSVQHLRTAPLQPNPSAATAAWLVHLLPAAASLARAARGQAVSHSGLGQARAPGQTPAPATAPSGPMRQRPPAVLPAPPGPTLRAPKAHRPTAPPAQSPIPAQLPAPREKPVPDGSPSPASVAPASPPPARAPNPSLEAPPNPATGLNPAERNADKNGPTALHSGAASCSP